MLSALNRFRGCINYVGSFDFSTKDWEGERVKGGEGGATVQWRLECCPSVFAFVRGIRCQGRDGGSRHEAVSECPCWPTDGASSHCLGRSKGEGEREEGGKSGLNSSVWSSRCQRSSGRSVSFAALRILPWLRHAPGITNRSAWSM